MGAAEFGVTNTSTNTINEFLITPWKGAITSLRSCNVRTSSAGYRYAATGLCARSNSFEQASGGPGRDPRKPHSPNKKFTCEVTFLEYGIPGPRSRSPGLTARSKKKTASRLLAVGGGNRMHHQTKKKCFAAWASGGAFAPGRPRRRP